MINRLNSLLMEKLRRNSTTPMFIKPLAIVPRASARSTYASLGSRKKVAIGKADTARIVPVSVERMRFNVKAVS